MEHTQIDLHKQVVGLFGEHKTGLSKTIRMLKMLTGKGTEAIAEHSGYSPGQIENVLRGHRGMQVGVQRGIAKTYGFDVLDEYNNAATKQ